MIQPKDVSYNYRDENINISRDSNMSSIDIRLSSVEKTLQDTRLELEKVNSHVERMDTRLSAELPHLATKAELAEVKSLISGVTTKIILWVVGVAIALGAFNWVTASFVHKAESHISTNATSHQE